MFTRFFDWLAFTRSGALFMALLAAPLAFGIVLGLWYWLNQVFWG